MGKITQWQKRKAKVFEKFNGRCGYTGIELPIDWEIDHITPLDRNKKGLERVLKNKIDNLIPTFKFINMFKKRRDLEEWRSYLLNFHKRIGIGKVNGVDMRMRAKHMGRLIEVFDIKKDKPFSGLFYFETLKLGDINSEQTYTLPYENTFIKSMRGEIWQPLIEYKSYYSVSNFGRIKTSLRVDSKGQTREGIIKKSQISQEGYLKTLISVDNVRFTKRVDFLVAETFIPNPGNLKYLHHKNGNKLDIRVSNLYWSNRKIINNKYPAYKVDLVTAGI